MSNPFAQEDDREDVLIYYLVVILIALFVVKIQNEKSMERDTYRIDEFIMNIYRFNKEKKR